MYVCSIVNDISTFVIEDHMLDWHPCQICYPLEIKLLSSSLLLLLLYSTALCSRNGILLPRREKQFNSYNLQFKHNAMTCSESVIFSRTKYFFESSSKSVFFFFFFFFFQTALKTYIVLLKVYCFILYSANISCNTMIWYYHIMIWYYHCITMIT